MSRPDQMVTCGGGCKRRRRTVKLWNTNRRGKPPLLHVGLPDGWSVVGGRPCCLACQESATRRAAYRSGRASPEGAKL